MYGAKGGPNAVCLDCRGDESRQAALADSIAKNGSGKVTTAEEDNRLVGVKMYYPRNDNDDIARTDSAFLREDEKEVKAMEAGSSRFEIRRYDVLWERLAMDWPRGRQNLELTVRRPGEDEDIKLPPFRPKTLGLHPTQLYETISMAILFLLLTAYYPFRRLDGQVMGLFLTLYAVHRFLNELLRNDTDPVAFGMTLSQNGSVLVLLLGLVLLNRDRLARALQPVRRALVGG